MVSFPKKNRELATSESWACRARELTSQPRYHGRERRNRGREWGREAFHWCPTRAWDLCERSEETT
jgi:hypothetical protein